jgi:hypothetical protein
LREDQGSRLGVGWHECRCLWLALRALVLGLNLRLPEEQGNRHPQRDGSAKGDSGPRIARLDASAMTVLPFRRNEV